MTIVCEIHVVIPTDLAGVLLATGSLFHPTLLAETWFIAQGKMAPRGGRARWGPQSLTATGI